MAVVGLLLVAGIAYLGSFASGTLHVYVREAPANWKHLTVVFSDIQVHRVAAGDASDWISLPLSSPAIDFAELGDLPKLLALDRVAPGKYTQLRLIVDSVTGVLADGTPVTLIVPDGVLKMGVPFNIPGRGAVSVTLEFDLATSIHVSGGKWIFRPVLGSVQVS
jgi:hypothetical protein